MQYKIEFVNDSNKHQMVDFLNHHENTTLFLLGNFENYGFTLSESPYSGNFKIIRSLDKIVGVFCLTKKGSLLIESTVMEPVFDLVLASCKNESIPILGVVGNWDCCRSLWTFLKNKRVIKNETYTKKEILYTVDLSKEFFSAQPHVRLLKISDYGIWKTLRLDNFKEEGLPNNLSEDQMKNNFLEKVNKKIVWGYFIDDQLVSVADLNAKASDLGQVGGVYTIPSYRQKGYSKSVMKQVLFDSKTLHSIRKLIIFTAENNFPAQKLYISLGAKEAGYFSLLFGN